jgi:pyruvate formate lyase activating enzyme
VSVAELLERVLPDKAFYRATGGGVTLSGGEILSHPDFARAILRACAAESVPVALDTCGYGDYDLLRELAAGCQIILYDVKLMDPAAHLRYTGRDNRLILRNLTRLARSGCAPIRIRTPVIAGVNDDAGHTAALIELLRDLRLPEIELLPYHELGTTKNAALGRPVPEFAPPDRETLAAIAAGYEAAGIRVI